MNPRINNFRQFGRYVEVNIRDFEKKTEVIFGNEFEIEFDFYKTIDKTQEDDVGKVKIYGLSEKTIAGLQDSGGEITLYCGYGTHLPLFQAYIVRIYSMIENNTTVTVIDCSANFLNYYHIGSTGTNTSPQASGKSLHLILSEILLENMGVTNLKFTTDTPQDSATINSLIEYTQTASAEVSFIGTSTEILTQLLVTYGLQVSDTKEDKDGRLIEVTLMFSELGLELAKKNIAQGYPKATLFKKTDFIAKSVRTPTEENAKLFSEFESMFVDDVDSLTYTMLNESTGLLSLTPEYKSAKVSATTPLSSNEIETLKSQQSRADKAQRDKERDEKRAEKIRKAIEAGRKPPKYKDGDSEKVATLTVIRKYARVKALLNPLVRPQSQVALYDRLASEFYNDLEQVTNDSTQRLGEDSIGRDGIYVIHRVRHVTYKGNNKRGDWIMDLYCEDTENNLTDEQLRRELSKSEETIQDDEGGDFEGSDGSENLGGGDIG